MWQHHATLSFYLADATGNTEVMFRNIHGEAAYRVGNTTPCYVSYRLREFVTSQAKHLLVVYAGNVLRKLVEICF